MERFAKIVSDFGVTVYAKHLILDVGLGSGTTLDTLLCCLYCDLPYNIVFLAGFTLLQVTFVVAVHLDFVICQLELKIFSSMQVWQWKLLFKV